MNDYFIVFGYDNDFISIESLQAFATRLERKYGGDPLEVKSSAPNHKEWFQGVFETLKTLGYEEIQGFNGFETVDANQIDDYLKGVGDIEIYWSHEAKILREEVILLKACNSKG